MFYRLELITDKRVNIAKRIGHYYVTAAYIPEDVRRPKSCLLKGCTQCIPALTCAAALNIHMLRRTLIIVIIGTIAGFTVNADIIGRMAGTAGIGIAAALSRDKALAAGLTLTAGALAAHHDVSLGAQVLLVVYAVFHNTL